MSNGTRACVWEPAIFWRHAQDVVTLCIDCLTLNFKSCSHVPPWYLQLLPSDFLVLALATALILTGKAHLVTRIYAILLKRHGVSNNDLKRVSELVYEFVSRAFMVSWIFLDVILLPECSFLAAPTHGLRRAIQSPALETPYARRLLLLLNISRYVAALIDLLRSSSEKRRDAVSLAIHHMVAVGMLTAALSTFPELGLTVLLLHEACDPSLEVAKITHYLSRSKLFGCSRCLRITSEVSVVVFAVKWFILRIYLYPTRSLFLAATVDRESCDYGVFAAAGLLGSLLFLLNVVWSFMIVRALTNALIYRRITDETMERPRDYDMTVADEDRAKSA